MIEPHRVFYPHLQHIVLQELGLGLFGNLGSHELLPAKQQKGDSQMFIPLWVTEELLENSTNVFGIIFLHEACYPPLRMRA